MAKQDEIFEGLDPNAEIPVEPEAPKKRGRKPGSTNGPRYSGPKKGFDVDGLAKNIQALHELAAVILGQPIGPILRMEEKDAKALAVAVSNLVAQYDFIVDPKTLAWINFVSVLASIYVPRWFMIQMVMAAHRQQQQNQAWSNVGSEPPIDSTAVPIQ